MPLELPKNFKCDCNGGCIRCLIKAGKTEDLHEFDIDDSKREDCSCCGAKFTIPGGYYGTGMCGPCCTGESELAGNRGTKW